MDGASGAHCRLSVRTMRMGGSATWHLFAVSARAARETGSNAQRAARRFCPTFVPCLCVLFTL